MIQTIEKELPKGMYLPEIFKKVFQWIAESGYEHKQEDKPVGYLIDIYVEDAAHSFRFMPQGDYVHEHFKDFPQSKERLYLFGFVDDDGCLGLWLDDQGKQHIVLVGNDYFKSIPFVVIDEKEAIRLLSLGYRNSYSWYDYPNSDEYSFIEEVPLFRQWCETNLNLSMPQKISDIKLNFVSLNDWSSDDLFWNWDRENNPLWEYCKYNVLIYKKIEELFPNSAMVSSGFYEYHDMFIMLLREVASYLESDSVDCNAKETINKVKIFSTYCLEVSDIQKEKGEYEFPYNDIFTDYVVGFLEHLFTDKLHVLIPHIEGKKADFVKNKEFYTGYCSVSEEMYNKTLKLFDKGNK